MNQLINNLINKLDLEKTCVIEKVTIFCVPKKDDKEFRKKFLDVEKEVKKISNQIDLKIIEEGEIDYVKGITLSTES